MTLLKLAGKKDGLAGFDFGMEQPGESLYLQGARGDGSSVFPFY